MVDCPAIDTLKLLDYFFFLVYSIIFKKQISDDLQLSWQKFSLNADILSFLNILEGEFKNRVTFLCTFNNN
jgi:hypothetical protein